MRLQAIKTKAEALYKDIAMYNFNGIDFAVIRNEVVRTGSRRCKQRRIFF